ncbi:hypothetical protein [Psychroserpens luteolus]|uniref:hypothetical protein n=1 Tax=Psychroserpens luteolus TaxID=2855840 RepID=UPI001E34CF64|nr:hypothetical protein [Psychroserpens luteolus]MCD2257587.1 hypothetical protein [Psychroserpens luteolus]
MLSKIWTYLQYGNRFCGIEHTNNDSIIVSVLKQSKKELDLDSGFEAKTIEEVSKTLQKNQHATLVVNNENVLSKTIESEQKDISKLVFKAFPNINIEDFYIEIISEGSSHFISICRQDYVDGLIASYSEKNIHIITVSLGNSLISSIKPFLKTNRVQTSNAHIAVANTQITEITKDATEDKSYDINGLNVSSRHLLSFSGALQTILKSDTTITNYEQKNNDLHNGFKQVQFFNQFLKFAGLFILSILLINFFVFNHYFNQVNDLKQISEVNASTKQHIVDLDASVAKKQKMVDDLLKSNGSKTSFYANRVMLSLPQTVLLSEFNFQPLNKRIKANKPIDLNTDIISISGSSSDSEAFSNWVSQLEDISWIEKVDIVNYESATSKVSDFKLKIVLTND